ncbi:SWIRM domain-containing protein [Apiospora arundinis]|uniref:SWIRM domain-containing protein n=1 Tax=Apiospora arundinis TaxID=335852 RepID=A0ABR2JKG8_9PEZI
MASSSYSSQLPSTASTSHKYSTTNTNNTSNNNKTYPPMFAMATTAAAPTSTSSQNKEPKKPFDISNLMSPPELPPYESFAQSTMAKSTNHVTSDMRKVPGPNAPISPPISPETRMHDNAFSPSVSPKTTTPCKDPILYPAHELTNSPPQRPLFAPDESVAAQRIVDEHVHARSQALFRQASPPQREDYELALFFKSQVMKKFMENPRGWLQRERAQLLEDRRAGARHNQFRLHPILAAKPQPIRQHVQRIVKPAAPKPARAPQHQVHHHQPSAAAPRPIRSNPPPIRAVPTTKVIKSPTPEPASRRIVAPNREDKDFLSLPDICPPLSTLPPKSNSMKVDWKGAPIDLSADPHRDLLHPDELALAANLRLDCATYLTSKRRMFMKRLECLRIGKEFRKTDAQQACKIDVNKASKLWTAFDKVGWLEKHHVASYV